MLSKFYYNMLYNYSFIFSENNGSFALLVHTHSLHKMGLGRSWFITH